MGASVPSGPSPQQAAYDAWLERQRVKYEEEKRQFRERVGTYETLASDYQSNAMNTFEYTPGGYKPPEAEALMDPARFTPSFRPRDINMRPITDPTAAYARTPGWFWAPNLGISRGTTKTPSEVQQMLTRPTTAFIPNYGIQSMPTNKPTKPVIVDNYWTGRL